MPPNPRVLAETKVVVDRDGHTILLTRALLHLASGSSKRGRDRSMLPAGGTPPAFGWRNARSTCARAGPLDLSIRDRMVLRLSAASTAR